MTMAWWNPADGDERPGVLCGGPCGCSGPGGRSAEVFQVRSVGSGDHAGEIPLRSVAQDESPGVIHASDSAGALQGGRDRNPVRPDLHYAEGAEDARQLARLRGVRGVE